MRTKPCERGLSGAPTGLCTASWVCLVGTVVCLVGTVPVPASAQYAGAEEGVELRFHAPDVDGLSLSFTGPQGTGAPTSMCELPCRASLVPGRYSLRVDRSDLRLARSTRQRLDVNDSRTYRVEYTSRRGWRIFGGVFLAAMTLVGATFVISSAVSGGFAADLARRVGIGILVGGIAIGAPTLALPDRARFVPEP
jgi:hypothetical protein